MLVLKCCKTPLVLLCAHRTKNMNSIEERNSPLSINHITKDFCSLKARTHTHTISIYSSTVIAPIKQQFKKWVLYMKIMRECSCVRT